MRTSGRVTECKLVLVRTCSPLAPVAPCCRAHCRAYPETLPLWTCVSQLGDSNVGKSSLVLRFVKNQFNADQVTTVGAAFLQSPVPLDDSEDKIQFGIWDTAGSERYKALAPMYYRGAEAAIVVYDITSFESFEGAKSWVRELKLYGQPNVVVALAANKCDLEQYRVVSTHEGQAYARENELTYFETSAKTAHNVRRMFVELGAPIRPLARPHAPRPRRRGRVHAAVGASTPLLSPPSPHPSCPSHKRQPLDPSIFPSAVPRCVVCAAQRVPRKDASALTASTSLDNPQRSAGGGCVC